MLHTSLVTLNINKPKMFCFCVVFLDLVPRGKFTAVNKQSRGNLKQLVDLAGFLPSTTRTEKMKSERIKS